MQCLGSQEKAKQVRVSDAALGWGCKKLRWPLSSLRRSLRTSKEVFSAERLEQKPDPRGERRTQASGLHYMHFMPHSDGDGAGRRVAGEGRKAT